VDGASREAYHLSRKATPIGRDAQVGIQLRDTAVSRHHADVRAEGGGYVLYSSGQTGTKLNGANVTAPMLLNEGDQVQIANTTLTFTRNALPAGVKLVEPKVQDEDELTRRSTTVQNAIPTGEVPSIESRPGMNPIVIGIGVLLLVVVIYFVFMR
jgi:pSer/pThr/pTyr-binding forkhead associated (FHA) protein